MTHLGLQRFGRKNHWHTDGRWSLGPGLQGLTQHEEKRKGLATLFSGHLGPAGAMHENRLPPRQGWNSANICRGPTVQARAPSVSSDLRGRSLGPLHGSSCQSWALHWVQCRYPAVTS